MENSAVDKRVEAAFFPIISSPSLVGKTVIVKQAVLLTSDRRAPIPSQDLKSQWHTMGLLPVTVAGPCRHFTGLPY